MRLILHDSRSAVANLKQFKSNNTKLQYATIQYTLTGTCTLNRTNRTAAQHSYMHIRVARKYKYCTCPRQIQEVEKDHSELMWNWFILPSICFIGSTAKEYKARDSVTLWYTTPKYSQTSLIRIHPFRMKLQMK